MPASKKSMAKKRREKADIPRAEGPEHSNGVVVALSLIIFLLVAAGLFGAFQTRLKKEIGGISNLSQKTKVELQQEIEVLKNELAEANASEEARISERLSKLELSARVDCSNIGSKWSTFVDVGNNWAFCYLNDWGEPELVESTGSAACEAGTSWSVAFGGEEAPTMRFDTPDFDVACPATGNLAFCWSCINDLSDDEEVIEESLQLEEEAEIELFATKSAHAVLKLEAEILDEDEETIQTSGYYIPKSIRSAEYNLQVVTNGDEDNVETMIKNMFIGEVVK